VAIRCVHTTSSLLPSVLLASLESRGATIAPLGGACKVTLPGQPPESIPTLDGALAWSAPDVARHSAELAVACARAGPDPDGWPKSKYFPQIIPTGKTPRAAYLRAADPRWWRRQITQKVRIAQEQAEKQLRLIGKHKNERAYAGQTAADWYAYTQAATAAWLESAVLLNRDTGETKPIKDVMKTPEQRAAKMYSVLRAMQDLATAAGLRWAMLTLTLPGQWHSNPEFGARAWNGMDARVAHAEIAEGWKRLRANLAKHDIRVTGVRAEEPNGDGTPHWHVLLLYRDNADFKQICRGLLTQFPGGLRIRESHARQSKNKLRFSTWHYVDLVSYDKGLNTRNHRLGAQVQIDVGATGSGSASLAAYVAKYIVKHSGVDVTEFVKGQKALSKTERKALEKAARRGSESAAARAVAEHRQTYGLHSVQFFGLPEGLMGGWDQLRSIKLNSAENLPPVRLAGLASIAQQPKGAGLAEIIRRLGGLAITRQGEPALGLRAMNKHRTNRYSEPARKRVGIELYENGVLIESHETNPWNREILSAEAAEAILALPSGPAVTDIPICTRGGSRPPIPPAEAARIGELAQKQAIEAPIDQNHAVFAAAGSGKTYVLTRRAQYLVNHGVPQNKVVAVAFTRKSAEKLRVELDRMGLKDVLCGTMHRLSGLWLHRAGQNAGGYDEAVQKAAVLGKPEYHLLVDEAQDLTDEQWRWVHAWGRTVHAVGDERQTIYAWRGAAKAGLKLAALRMTSPQKDMFGAGVLELPVNRRSRTAIVEFGNRIAAAFSPAVAVREGGEVRIDAYRQVDDELGHIVAWACTAGPDAAVLARTNAEVARITAALRLGGLQTSVMTIHEAKGLEWETVLISLGTRKKSENADDAEQVAYVAVTRARDRLMITSTGQLPDVISRACA